MPAKAKGKELTDLEREVAENYLSNGFSRKQAVIDSSSKAKESSAKAFGHEIINRPHVAAYIEKRLEETILSTNQILGGISDLAESAELQRDRLKAYELLGKHRKLFTEQSEININVSELSDDKLAAIARG